MENVYTEPTEATVISFPGSEDMESIAPEPLLDISIDEEESDQLAWSPYVSQIRIQLQHGRKIEWHPGILTLVEENTSGRDPAATIEKGYVLDVVFMVSENEAATNDIVNAFAYDIVRLLDLPEESLLQAQTIRLNDGSGTIY